MNMTEDDKERGLCSSPIPGGVEAEEVASADTPDDALGWSISAAAFRLTVDGPRLTRAERETVAARPRFYSMPWLVSASCRMGRRETEDADLFL